MKTAFAALLCLMCVPLTQAQETASLKFNRSIELKLVTGKFDHFAYDSAANRLFVAAAGNHSVEVINLKTDKVDQSIIGLGKPQGLAWVASTGSLYVADGTLAELRLYKGSPLALAGTIKLSDDADDMTYDEANQMLFVGHGGKGAENPARVALIDTKNFSLVTNLSVATHPEALDIDPQSKRVFVNIADSNEVVVIGANSRSIAAHWKVTKAADNTPIAFDAEHQLLFLACRKPGTLIAIDAANGNEVASLPAGDGVDDMFYDTVLRRVYVISGAGEVDVYQVDRTKNVTPLGVIQTAPGAKTALFVPFQNSLFVGVPGTAKRAAEIRVYSTVAR